MSTGTGPVADDDTPNGDRPFARVWRHDELWIRSLPVGSSWNEARFDTLERSCPIGGIGVIGEIGQNSSAGDTGESWAGAAAGRCGVEDERG